MSTHHSHTQNRVLPGVPQAGQFAKTIRPGADPAVALTDTADEAPLDQIADLLGKTGRTSDVLADVAEHIAATGRPHPGEADSPGQYRELFRSYLLTRGRSSTPDEKALDEIALALGTSPSWSTASIDEVANFVHKSGRPHPGGDRQQAERDARILDKIGLFMAATQEWDTGDMLATIADDIAASGRPHPGDAVDEYRAVFDTYLARRGPATTPEQQALDRMALMLGTAPEWEADHLEYAADIVAEGDRPHPGDQGIGAEYYRKVRAHKLKRGYRQPDPRDEFEANLSQGVYGDNTDLLRQLIDRELRHDPEEDGYFEGPEVAPRAFAGIDDDFLAEVTEAREKLTRSLHDYVADQTQHVPLGSSEPDVEQVRAHVKDVCARAGAPHMEPFIWNALADSPVARQGGMALDRFDVQELDVYYLDPVIDTLQERLAAKAGQVTAVSEIHEPGSWPGGGRWGDPADHTFEDYRQAVFDPDVPYGAESWPQPATPGSTPVDGDVLARGEELGLVEPPGDGRKVA